MIAFPSVLNLELGFLFGDFLSASSSRTQLSIPRKFIFCNPNLKYGSWTSASFKSKVVPPTLVTTTTAATTTAATTTTEVKVVLHKFLREQGYSSTLARATIKKSDPFIEHLVARLSSLKKSCCPVGHELTATEIRDALIPYLESLVEDCGNNLIDFLENFPNSAAKRFLVASISSSNPRKLKALTRVTGTVPDGQLTPTVLYLLEFGMDVEQIARLVYRYPRFVNLSLDGRIRPIIEFLLSLGLSNSDISTLIIRLPQLCSFNLSKRVIPNVKFLQNFGLSKRQVGRIIYRFPIVVSLSRQKLDSIVDFLYKIGIPEEYVGKVLHRFPQITGCSLENNLLPKVEYFRSSGVRVDIIILRWPQALSLSIEDNLQPTTEFFLSKGYSKEEVTTMFSRLGSLYTCSLQRNLTPKWEFFLTMDYSKEELVKFPQYFSYSLEQRIKPRYAEVQSSGVKFTLSHLLTLSDDNFDKTLRKKLKRAGRR